MANKKKKNVYAEELEKIESGNYTSKIFTGNEKLEIAPLPGSKINQNNNDSGQTSLFADGYDFGDITKTGLNILSNAYNKNNRLQDGWQFGDVTKTLLGTAKDIEKNARKGAASTIEGLGDFGINLLSGLVDDNTAKKMREFAQKDIAGELSRLDIGSTFGGFYKASDLIESKDFASLNPFDKEAQARYEERIQRDSLSGNTADQLAQGLGQLGGQVALQSLGIPWQFTAFTSSAGNEMNNAFQNNATYGQAFVSGLISGAVEVGTEYLGGGANKFLGMTSLGSKAIEKLGGKISNKLVAMLTKAGLDMAGEGLEEVLSGYGTAIGQKLTYMTDKEINELYSSDEALEEFISGALVSGIANIPGSVQTVKRGANAFTGMTDNEQKVYDKLVEERTKEAQENGKKLTKKQIEAIENDVMDDFTKGNISTDKIESILGHADNVHYMVNQAENMSGRTLTPEELNDINLEAYENYAESIKKDDIIKKNYYEDELRHQKFNVDLDSLDDDMKKFYQTQIDEGVADNSTKAHNYMDMMAKIWKDKGIMSHIITDEMATKTLIDDAVKKYMEDNNITSLTTEQRQELENKYKEEFKDTRVNGYMRDGELYININSKNALETIVGHEITHLLEKNTDLYDNLRKSLKEYAESKGEYKNRLDAIKNQPGYNNLTEDAQTKELTADLVGDYIFTSQDYINSLAQNRNLFQKIYDEIKYLVKQVTAGSDEQRKLNKAVKMFEKAYKEMSVKLAEQETKTSGVQYSLSDDIIEQTGSKKGDAHSDFFIDRTTDFDRYQGNTPDGKAFVLRLQKGNNEAKVSLTENDSKIWIDELYVKNQKEGYGKEIVDAIKNYAYETGKTIETFKEVGSAREFWNKMFGESENEFSHKYFKGKPEYWQNKINDVQERIDRFTQWKENALNDGNQKLADLHQESIDREYKWLNEYQQELDKANNDKIQYSLSTDSNGRELTEQQQEYFKDSKVRDENGNLKVMYHGSSNDFTIFDRSRAKGSGLYGRGLYFAYNTDMSDLYEKDGKTYEVYINSVNPLERGQHNITKEQFRNLLEYINSDANEDIDLYNYGTDNIDEILDMVYTGDDFRDLQDISATATGDFVETLEMFNKINGTNYDGIAAGDQFIAFYPEQIKNVDNLNPTSNPDIRYSLSSTGELVNQDGNKANIQTTTSQNDNNLMVMQGLSTDNLKNVLSLGGLPVPSLGITDANLSTVFDEFGGKNGVVLLFSKDTINPKNKSNEVYDRDVYSKTIPEIYQKVNKKVYNDVMREFRPYESEYGSFNRDYSYNSSLDKIINDLSYSTAAKAKFLDDNDYNFEKAYKNYKSSYGFTEDVINKFINEYPELASFNPTMVDTVDEVNEIAPQIKEIALDMMAESNPNFSRKQFAELFKDEWRLRDINDFYHDINGYRRLNGQKEFDIYGTRDNIDKVVEEHKDEYENWLRNKFTDAYGEKYFEDDNGRKKEYTLENLTSYMKKGKTTAQQKGMFDSYSIGQAKGDAAKRFMSIEQIKEASDRLVDIETYKERHKAFEDIDDSVRTEIGDTRLNNGEDLFEVYSDYYMALGQAAKGVDVQKALNNNNFYDLSDEQITKFKEVADALSNLPAKYFEAKPQRTVNLDEIKGIVVPNTIDNELRQQLLKNGYTIAEYNPNVEGDKQRVINQFDDLKFSLANDDIAPVRKPGLTYGEDIAYQEDIAPTGIDYTIDRDIMDLFHQEIERKGGKKVQLTKPVIAKEKSGLRNGLDTLSTMFVNQNTEIDNLAKESGNKNIKFAGDMLNNYSAEAQNDITVAQTDNYGNAIGKSVQQLFEPAKAKGLEAAFNDYLINYSNIDRWARGKGSQTPVDVSERLVKNYEEQHPEFKKWAKDVWKFGENVRKNWLEAGMIKQSMYDLLSESYPHYVPYISDTNSFDATMDKLKELKARPIKRAVGGATELFPVEEALTRYTFAQKRAYRQNELFKQIYNTLQTNPGQRGADVGEGYFTGEEPNLYRDDSGNYITALFDGEEHNIQISDDLFKALRNDMQTQIKDLENKLSIITKPLQTASNIRRKMLTSWSPSFTITNPLKDIQDAFFNSKHLKEMAKNYVPGIKELWTGSTPEARQFLALYGEGNLMGQFANESGLYDAKKGNKNNKFLKGLSKVNNIMELAPRYAEFKASLQAGESLAESMYNAREITTNFSRGGVITKALNRNGFTFLNASVQGFDKFIRNFSGENGARGIASSLLRAVMLGVVPAVFNELAFGGGDDKDEDYDALPDYIKDNYYLIKTGDGSFVRIPKGRMLSVFGSAARRTIELAEGEENAFEGYLSNVNNQIGINNPEENNIFSPFIQAYGSENGTAWYGGDIVPTRLQDKPKNEQYDASTDKFSIWLSNTALGKKMGLSPYKVNYVLDQYSGGIGDILLPMITDEATSNGSLLAPITDKFTADSTTDNKYVSDFYTKNDELKVKANSSEATDDDYLRNEYMKSISKEMSQLYAERRNIQADNSLSKSEKYEKSQAIKEQINKLAKYGLDSYDNISVTGNYAQVGDDMGYYKNAKGNWTPIDQKDIIATESIGLNDREKSTYYGIKNDMYNIDQKYEPKLKTASDEEKTVLNAQKKVDIINSIKNANLPDEAKAKLYDKKYASTETLNAVIDCGIDFDSYLDLQAQNFTADKNIYGKTINGSKKNKVYNYINNLNMPYEQKIMLAKLEYKSDDTYNREIINYLNNDNSISYQDMTEILKAMGFKVDEYGNITWE